MSTIYVEMGVHDRFAEVAEEIGYRAACLAVSVEAAGRELERLRQQRVRDRESLGLPVPECVPAGMRLVPTGLVTVCCDLHVGCSSTEPCCPECTTTV